MRKWFFMLAVIVILVLVGFRSVQHQIGGSGTKHVKTETEQEAAKQGGASAKPEEESPSKEKSPYLDVSSNQVHLGNLLLVNKDHPVSGDAVKKDVVNLFDHKDLMEGYSLLDAHIMLSEDLARHFMTMVDAARKDGVDHFLISSGYRDFDKQEELYKEKGSEYALPAGASEHNLGLSMDIGSSLKEMDKAPEGKWLKENAWKYGFILRYPEDKISITGIQYEPWHFRYVGLPHSAVMYEKNMALEEYLDYLKQQGKITETVEGKTYEIAYYPSADMGKIDKPASANYEISGDNIDGVIVTTEKEQAAE